MSQKVILAVAATAALVATTTDARRFKDWSSTGPYNPNPPFRGFDAEEEQAIQKINWGKVVKGVNTGLDLYGKAKGVGLFDEDEEEAQKLKINWKKVGKGINTGLGVVGKTLDIAGKGLDIAGKAHQAGLFEEDEEEQAIQKITMKARKAKIVLDNAHKLGLFDEDADLDEVQRLKLVKVVKGALEAIHTADMLNNNTSQIAEEDEQPYGVSGPFPPGHRYYLSWYLDNM